MKKTIPLILIFILCLSSVSALNTDVFNNRCESNQIKTYIDGRVALSYTCGFSLTCGYVNGLTGVLLGATDKELSDPDVIAKCVPKSELLPNFKVTKITNDNDFSFSEIGKESFGLHIYNAGGTGTKKVELGIAKCSTIENWGASVFSAVGVPVSNCNAYEKNVLTKEVTINAGETYISSYTVEVPDVTPKGEGLFWDFGRASRDMCVFVTAYDNCYNTGQSTGATDSVLKQVFVKDNNPNARHESCTDGIENQDESDTDCGGSYCRPCKEAYKCASADDCSLGLSCGLNGRCSESNFDSFVCDDKTGIDNLRCELGTFNFGNGATIGVLIFLFIIIFIIIKQRR